MKLPPLDDEVVLRAATPADLDDISRVMNHPPEPPSVILLGAERARRVGDLMVRAGVSVSLADTTVAVVDGRVAGFMDCGGQQAVRGGILPFIRLLPRLFWILGPVMPRAVRGTLARQRVGFATVADAFSIAELYVDERLRNRGIGGILLRHAEELARRSGAPRLSLETGTTNPARRLYERNGYRVVATMTDATYERLTGSPGRILMVKELTPAAQEGSDAAGAAPPAQ